MEVSKTKENGVLETSHREIVARHGRAYAAVSIALCEDGGYRVAVEYQYSDGGSSSSIFASSASFATEAMARAAAREELLRRWPTAWPSEPASVHEELRELRAQLESQIRQPSFL